ncbi:hypothetical protein LY78DRAFT_150245 [Colletotrichum sublineola]|nr:hypothetical protein LY78DRAFT_150245 [Colletotrichum sublineola]
MDGPRAGALGSSCYVQGKSLIVSDVDDVPQSLGNDALSALLRDLRKSRHVDDVPQSLGNVTLSALLRDLRKSRHVDDLGKWLGSSYRSLPGFFFVLALQTRSLHQWFASISGLLASRWTTPNPAPATVRRQQVHTAGRLPATHIQLYTLHTPSPSPSPSLLASFSLKLPIAPPPPPPPTGSAG